MLNVGKEFANFLIEKKIGEGGMGEVFLATDKKLNRKVALKVLPADFFEDKDKQERFKREAKTAAQISHPNIMLIHDINQATEPKSGKMLQYIVMEYIDGVPLGKYYASKNVELSQTLKFAEKISNGLSAAHKLNIVHRDIKADNIIIDQDDNPKILDFGLAKPVEAVLSSDNEDTDSAVNELTRAGTVVGTVSYMSPEQARGEQVDTRSDIFSFGILLYRMTTGELPFSGSTQVSTLAKILETQHESPRVKNENIPLELERIVDKCLAKNPSERYQNTGDLVIDLRNLRRKFDSGISDTISTVDGSAYQPLKSKKISWQKIAIPVAVIAILVYVFIFQLGGGGGTTEVTAVPQYENGLAILSFENKTGDEQYKWLETGLPEMLLTDIAQSGSINVISRSRVLDCLTEDQRGLDGAGAHQACVDAAKDLGAANALSGTILKLGGDVFRIDARVEDVATGKIILAEKVVGNNPLSLVDSLTAKIIKSLNIESSGQGRAVSEMITSSHEAYKEYHLGLEELLGEEYDRAIEHFQKAVELDTSFALAYMRIGMSLGLRGKATGAQYFQKALDHSGQLPIREKSLLDIYADLWLRYEFGKGFTKLEAYVDNYPDDKEAKTIYGFMRFQIADDTLDAYRLFEEVFEIDPRFQLALNFYVAVARDAKDYPRAIDYANRLVRYYPKSTKAYLELGNLYRLIDRIEDARKINEDVLEKFPGNETALGSLRNHYIKVRDFEKARYYLNQIKEYHSDNLYSMYNYYNNLANLENWKGNFKTGLKYCFDALKEAKATEDSNKIYNSYSILTSTFVQFDQFDSASYYSAKSYGYGTFFSKIGYPMSMVKYDKTRKDEAIKLFNIEIKKFKTNLPSEMWHIPEFLEKYFSAQLDSDTAQMIKVLGDYVTERNEEASGNLRYMAQLMILTGEYQKGREKLKRFVSGKYESSNGLSYPIDLYYLGVASQGLGENQEAIDYFTEMLGYWSKPQIELKEIKDARKRLAELQKLSLN